jgi:dihydrofolate reductase
LTIKDAKVVSSFKDALAACDVSKDIFIIGGSKIYEIALSCSDYLFLTIIHKKFEGDTYFPNYDLSRWMLISETRNYDLVNKFSYSYLTYQAQ